MPRPFDIRELGVFCSFIKLHFSTIYGVLSPLNNMYRNICLIYFFRNVPVKECRVGNGSLEICEIIEKRYFFLWRIKQFHNLTLVVEIRLKTYLHSLY